MGKRGKLLFVHHFSLAHVTGITAMVSELLATIASLHPEIEVAYQSFEGVPSPSDLPLRLSSRHADATSVVALNPHIEVSWPFTLRLMEWGKQTGKPIYVYVHDYWSHHRGRIGYVTSRSNASLLASTPYVRDALASEGFDVILLPAGVPLGNVELDASVDRRSPAGRIVASAGRLVPRKRFGDVIRAFCDVSSDRAAWLFLRLLPSLVFSADDDRRLLAQLRDEAHKCAAGAGRVRIVRHATVKHNYRPYWVYVCASDYEGLSMAPIEAAYSGCPPILSDIRPHREIAETLFPDRYEAFLYPTGSYVQLGKILADELAGGERRAYLSTQQVRIRRIIRSRWSLSKTANTLAGLLDPDASIGPSPHRVALTTNRNRCIRPHGP